MNSFVKIGLIVVAGAVAAAAGLWAGKMMRQQGEGGGTSAAVERLEWMDPFEPDWTAATFKMQDAEGQPVSLPQGKVVLVNFWARWCQPCLREMPDIISLAKDMQDKDVSLYAVATMDGPPDQVEGFLNNNMWGDPVNFTFAADPDVLVPLGARGLPVTIVFDKNGKGRMQRFGPADWTSDEVKTYLAALAQE